MSESSGEFSLETGLEIVEAFELWMELCHKLNKLITGHHGTTDPVLDELKRIHSILNQLQGEELASWATQREESLALLSAHSSVSLQTIHAFAQSGKERTDPHWAPRLAIAERDSLIAIHTLTGNLDSGYWLRPDSIGAISWSGHAAGYSEGWMPHLSTRPIRNGLGQVWDYRWALPAATYAITCRLVVLRAAVPNREIVRQEISMYAKFMAEVYRRMEDGVKSLDQLSPDQLDRASSLGEVPVVVVDLHGGYYVGGLFQSSFSTATLERPPYPPELPQLPLPRASILPGYENMKANHALLTRHFRNHVAISIGLPGVLEFAGKLEQLHEKLMAPREDYSDNRITPEPIDIIVEPPPISG